MQGYVQVYTGDGKGKTTAALGLAVRALGAGLRVFLGQLAKGMRYSELEALEPMGERLTIEQYGRETYIVGKPAAEDKRLAQEALAEIRQALASGDYDVVIVDEANIATHFGLWKVDELLDLIDAKPEHVELVLTGRRAAPEVLERADLVTEMREVKHYYEQGVEARPGIEH